MQHWTPETRRLVFEAFHNLPAARVMDRELAGAAFLPTHCPITEVLEAFLTADHAWVHDPRAPERRVTSIIVRQDLLRALEPTHSSYTRLRHLRFQSLAHGSADCVCCFTEGRVLHPVAPATPCREVLRLMERKDTQYVPVMEQGVLVGEIGAAQLVRAVLRLQAEHG